MEPTQPPEPPDAPSRRNAVYVVMGFGTPVGFAGFEGVRRLGSAIELGVGLGRGFGALASQKDPAPGRDLQWAIMPRLRLGGDRHVVTAGAGVSGGNYGSGGEWFCDGPCPDRDSSHQLRRVGQRRGRDGALVAKRLRPAHVSRLRARLLGDVVYDRDGERRGSRHPVFRIWLRLRLLT